MDGPVSTTSPIWRVTDDLTDYTAACAAMQQQAAAIRTGEAPETVWLVEHPPLYTAGTSANASDVANPLGLPVFAAGRGGQWTYHGPGQRVAYVMLDLTRQHGLIGARDVRAYVWGLEEWLIRSLRAMDVVGERRPGRVGIWVVSAGQEAKVAAIGVRVTRWVSWHGVALNVSPTLAHFGGIVPCGLGGYGVTSLEALGVAAAMPEVDGVLQAAWSTVFGGVGDPVTTGR